MITCTNYKCPVFYQREPRQDMVGRCTKELCPNYQKEYNKHDFSTKGLRLIIKTKQVGEYWYNGINLQLQGGNCFGHACSCDPTPISKHYTTERDAVNAMLKNALWDAEHNIREQWAIDYIRGLLFDNRQLTLF